MRGTLKFLVALTVAFLLMLAFRALAFTIYHVDSTGMEPVFCDGDRVMVNRWSYGLRTGGESLFPYGRICRQPVAVGDIIAADDQTGQVLLCRCRAVPGDTTMVNKEKVLVPGLRSCAQEDYYLVEQLGRRSQPVLIAEHQIIGRVCLVIYSHERHQPIWAGYRQQRFLLPQ